MEGPLSLVENVETLQDCSRIDFCVTRDLWNELSEKINNTLKPHALQDLVEKHRSKQKSRSSMYYIKSLKNREIIRRDYSNL